MLLTTNAEARIRALGLWSGPLTIAPLAGGRSNESYRVEAGGQAYVVRFGQDFPFHHVSRAREAMTARAAHAAGLAPEVVHSADGVMVSRFVEARTWQNEDVQANLRRAAKLLRDFHQFMPSRVSGEALYFCPFHMIRDYARQLEAGGSLYSGRLPEYIALAAELQSAQQPMGVVFGHNDLIPQNILDGSGRLWLIDFEYAGFATPLFDLAGLASNARLGEDETEELLSRYFGRKPGARLRHAVSAMQCASLLREAMWSMVSELHLKAPGVDYAAYTAECLAALEAALEAWRSRCSASRS